MNSWLNYPYEQFQFCTLFDDTCHAQQYYEYIINNKDINLLLFFFKKYF